jgi:hypothetical protein
MRLRPHGCVRADYWFRRPRSSKPRNVHTKFRRNDGVVRAPFERPTKKFLVDIRPVYLRSVEEVDTEIKCTADRGDRLRLIRFFAVILAHSHAAESERRYFQVASKFAFLHCFSSESGHILSTAGRSWVFQRHIDTVTLPHQVEIE